MFWGSFRRFKVDWRFTSQKTSLGNRRMQASTGKLIQKMNLDSCSGIRLTFFEEKRYCSLERLLNYFPLNFY
jgi:hypothetical protein